ncbi:MAG: hypothetical protein EXS46_02345 [Candidatus Taylorbacteria bacterium]|nr:hypothetical protein [Candidatus Taylorbacteria bacterium]
MVTFYKTPGELRHRLALQTIGMAKQADYPVIIVDGSPDPSIAESFRDAGAVVFPQLHRGMGPARRQAFFHANEHAIRYGYELIFTTEPEKPIVPFIPQIVAPIDGKEVFVSIPFRSEKSWKTWPAFQAASEKRANAVYADAMGLEGFDPMMGPVAWHIQVAGGFMSFNPKVFGVPDTYIHHYVPPMLMAVTGKMPASVTVDMVYPPEQAAAEGVDNDEIRQKRAVQLESLSGAYRTLGQKLGLS